MQNKLEKTNPAIAILLATYNGSKFIDEFLRSLEAQSRSDFVVYIRDDGSNDDTLEIIDNHRALLKIEVIPSEKRVGAAKSFFELMEKSSKKHLFYLFADQDDWWYPDKVARATKFLADVVDEVALYCSRLEYVDSNLNHLAYSRRPHLFSLKNAVVENIATGCTVGITGKVIDEVLAARPYDYVMHDWWLYMYCSAKGRVLYDPDASIKYRQHGGNAIGAATTMLDDFNRRWTRFITNRGGAHPLSKQAKAFLACYGDALSPNDRSILERVVSGTRSTLSRWSLFLHPPVARQLKIDSLAMRLLFLLGRY